MDSRESLIEATRDLLWERGYARTTPRAILDRAGVGQGSMYHFFDGKEELAAAALQRSGEAMRRTSAAAFAAEDSVFARVTDYLLRERDVDKGCRMGRMTFEPDVVEAQALRAPVEDTLLWYRTRLAELLAEGQDSGELAPTFSPVRVAAMLSAVVQGGYVLARAARSDGPYREAVAGAVELLTAYRTERSA